MFHHFLRQFRTHLLVSQIRQVRPDLRPLADQYVIDQYLSDWLANRQAAIDLDKPYPMSSLYRRVLLHVGPAPKAVYVEQVYQLQRICQQQDKLIQADAEVREVMHEYEEQLLSIANDFCSSQSSIKFPEDVQSA